MAVTPSGKDKILRWARIYVGGYDLSGDALAFSRLVNEFGAAEFTGWDELVRNYLADGRRMVGVKDFQALMNDATGRSMEQLQSTPNSSQLSIGFGGNGIPAVGDPAYILPSIQLSDLTRIDAGRGVLSASFQYEADQRSANFETPAGVVLRGATSLAATLAASSANSVDFATASTSGWSAHIHVTATAAGNFAFKIRHSADDTAWADLGTFTTTGGSVGSELLSGSGSVNRYVAFDATRTAGTVTVVVTFARNNG